MARSKSRKPASTASNILVASPERMRRLKKLKVAYSVQIEDGFCRFEACVPNDHAKRILAPLGDDAQGRFRVMRNGKTGIDAIVTLSTLGQMMRAANLEAAKRADRQLKQAAQRG